MRKPRQCKDGDKEQPGTVSDTASALLSTCPVTSEVIEYLSKKMANGSNIPIKTPPKPSPLNRPGQQGFIIVGDGTTGTANVVGVQNNGFGYRPTNIDPYQPFSTTRAPIPEIQYQFPPPPNGKPPALPTEKKKTKPKTEDSEEDDSEEDDDDDNDEEEADDNDSDSESLESEQIGDDQDSEESNEVIPRKDKPDVDDEEDEQGDRTRAEIVKATAPKQVVAVHPPKHDQRPHKHETVVVYGKTQAAVSSDFDRIANNFGSSIIVQDEDDIFKEPTTTEKIVKPLSPMQAYLSRPFNFFSGPSLFPSKEEIQKNKPTAPPRPQPVKVEEPPSEGDEISSSEEEEDDYNDDESNEVDDYDDFRAMLEMRRRMPPRRGNRLNGPAPPMARNNVRPIRRPIVPFPSGPNALMHRSSAPNGMNGKGTNVPKGRPFKRVIDKRTAHFILPHHMVNRPRNVLMSHYYKRGRRSVRRYVPMPSSDLMMNSKAWPLRMKSPNEFLRDA